MLWLIGCESYQPRALDLEGYLDEVRARSVGSEAVRLFAERLGREGRSVKGKFDVMDGVSVWEAEVVALVYNAELRLARERLGVARARAEHAGLWDDPEFLFDVMKIVEGVPDPWAIGGALTFTLPLSGRLEVEKARAKAEAAVELERVAEAEWGVRRALRVLWSKWSAARLRLEEMRKLVESLEGAGAMAARLIEAGELDRTKGALLKIELATRRVELKRGAYRVEELGMEIREVMGLRGNAGVELVVNIRGGGEGGMKIDEKEVVDRNYALRRLRKAYVVAEHTLHGEIRKQYPDLKIGPALEDDEGRSKVGFVGGIPVPIFNANVGGIAAARAKREVASVAYERAYEGIVAKLARLGRKRQVLREEYFAMVKGVGPLVDRQLEDAKRLIGLGEAEVLVLLESLKRGYEVKEGLIETRLAEALVVHEIEYLSGPVRVEKKKDMKKKAADKKEVSR